MEGHTALNKLLQGKMLLGVKQSLGEIGNFVCCLRQVLLTPARTQILGWVDPDYNDIKH